MYIWGWGRDHSIACLEMDARDANAIQEEKGRAYLQRLTHRKNRYEHYLRHGTTEKYKKPMSYKMEKLARMGKYKDFEDLEHGRYSEKMKYLMMHKGYHHHKGDYYAMMMEEMYREGENGEDVSSDEEEISQQTEEKFKELEEERNKWHVDMDRTRYSTVYHTKDIVSNYILLGNDYSTERIIAMTDFLKEPVFLTKMCHLAVRWRQPSTLKVLIKYGAWVNVRISSDKKKRTPLHAACSLADYPCIELLLFSRSNPDLRDSADNTAVLLAMHAGCNEAAMKLLLYHSKTKLSDHVNNEGAGLLHRCGPFMEEKKGGGESSRTPVYRDNDITYKLVLERAKTSGELVTMVNLKDKEGNTPLYDAVKPGSNKNIQLLLSYGADVNIVYSKGNSIVHHAIKSGHVESLRLLLEAGAPVNVYNDDKHQPMRIATEKFVECSVKKTDDKNSYSEMIVLLLEYGASINVIVTDNDSRDTAFHALVRVFPPAYDLVSTCLEYGASVTRVNSLGEKARDIKVVSKRLESLLKEKSNRLRSLSEVCKWEIRDALASSRDPRPLQEAIRILTCLPPHLQSYLLSKGFSQPSYDLREDERMDLQTLPPNTREQGEEAGGTTKIQSDIVS